MSRIPALAAASVGIVGALLIHRYDMWVLGVLVILVSVYGAYRFDESQQHEHLGLASESVMYENGAVPTECPACETVVPVYTHKTFPNPSGGTICATCGSIVASDGEQVMVVDRNDEWFEKWD